MQLKHLNPSVHEACKWNILSHKRLKFVWSDDLIHLKFNASRCILSNYTVAAFFLDLSLHVSLLLMYLTKNRKLKFPFCFYCFCWKNMSFSFKKEKKSSFTYKSWRQREEITHSNRNNLTDGRTSSPFSGWIMFASLLLLHPLFQDSGWEN